MNVSKGAERMPWWRRLRSGMSLRVLMVVVLVIGGGLGWVVYRARVQRQAVAAIESAGGKVYYEWDWAGYPSPGAKPGPPRWLFDALGPDYLGYVVAVQFSFFQKDKADDALMAKVGGLDHLEVLEIDSCPLVTDAGLAHFQGLSRLKELDLNRTGVKGPGLIHLKGMSRLKELELRNVPIASRTSPG